MLTDFLSKVESLHKSEESFALATIVTVQGSASAKIGSKAIFNKDGQNIFGWVGGGCAERFVGEQAIEALQERKGRVVMADLDDEIFGLGVACGGRMEVFIDPIHPQSKIELNISSELKGTATLLASGYGIRILDGKGAAITQIDELLLSIGNRLAEQRGCTFKCMRDLKQLPVQFKKTIWTSKPVVSLIGKGRIIEALEKHLSLVGFEIRKEDTHNFNFENGQYVVIASHSSRDPLFVKQAFEQKVSYVGMVGSKKRALEVLAHLEIKENAQIDLPLFIPAGLDINAQNPDEIALSITCEILMERKDMPDEFN